MSNQDIGTNRLARFLRMHDKHRDDRSKPDQTRLFERALEHGGYFAAAQAPACGLSKALLAHHSKSGRFLRVAKGPISWISEFTTRDVIAAWLATGRDVAVVSHESALDILGLSDVIRVVHITVPRTRRYRSAYPGVAIHTTARRLGEPDIIIPDANRMTAATRSIVDAAESGTALEYITAAIGQALDRRHDDWAKFAIAGARGGRIECLVRVLEERGHQRSTEVGLHSVRLLSSVYSPDLAKGPLLSSAC